VVFEMTPSRLVRDAAGFGWNLEELQQQNRLKIIFTSPQVLEQELRSPDILLLEAASEIGAQRMFIDGLALLRTVSNGANGTPGNGLAAYRELLQQLFEGLQHENLTAMLSHEVSAHVTPAANLEMAEFLADTVIVLTRERYGRGIRRNLEIAKSRGQDLTLGSTPCALPAARAWRCFAACRRHPAVTLCSRPRPPCAQSSASSRSIRCSVAASSTAPPPWL